MSLAENRFLEAGKGAQNTKEKSRQCFTFEKCSTSHVLLYYEL
jgi:hypothetical protein